MPAPLNPAAHIPTVWWVAEDCAAGDPVSRQGVLPCMNAMIWPHVLFAKLAFEGGRRVKLEVKLKVELVEKLGRRPPAIIFA
tara:strand:+ start:10866 stop:11111 length:246 start_codon:yes stop_codon:yes gene_type:complete